MMPELSTIEVGISSYLKKDRPYVSVRTHCTTDNTELFVINFSIMYFIHCSFRRHSQRG